ncbi:MAG: ATP synthase F1 subunit delta [Deltaproteobacteria bacterium]|nr:ATP synthase F1 subunit delta [Deltaproteobacteria bacterium]
MIRTRITKRYTRALFELAADAGKIAAIGQDLAVVEGLLASDDALRDALLSPVLTRDAKSQVLDAVIDAGGFDPLVGNFLRILLDARKLPFVPDIAAAYRELADEASGRIRGVAVAPMALEDEDVRALAEALSKAVKKEVLLEAQLDPTLRGGLVARVGNLVFDGSLRTQLQRMRETLIKG